MYLVYICMKQIWSLLSGRQSGLRLVPFWLIKGKAAKIYRNLQKYISGSFPDKTKMTNGNRDNLLLCPTYFMLLFFMENCDCLQNFVLNTIKSLSENKLSKHLARIRLIVCAYFLWAKKIVHFYRVTSKVDVMAVSQKVDGHGRKGLILGSSLTVRASP